MVTKDEKYRARYLLFTPNPTNKEYSTLLACYDVEINERGYLLRWKTIGENELAKHEKWYAYMVLQAPDPWYNNQAYVNTLDKASMDKFIEITHKSYNRVIADEFDKTVPAIFTDEPQFTHKYTLKYATEKADVILPWTDDLSDTFATAYEG